jgi:hypothetical protein
LKDVQKVLRRTELKCSLFASQRKLKLRRWYLFWYLYAKINNGKKNFKSWSQKFFFSRSVRRREAKKARDGERKGSSAELVDKRKTRKMVGD